MNADRSSDLSLEDLAQRAATTPEEILRWRSLRLIGDRDRKGFTLADLETAHLVQFCLRRGFAIETIVRAEEAEGGFLRNYLDQLFPDGIASTYSLEEAAAAIRLDAALIRRLREIAGSATLTDRLDSRDVATLRGWKVALDAGLPEEALLQLVRVYADALGRVADAEARLFHFYVHEQLRRSGLSGRQLSETTEAASRPMRELIEPTLLYFHRNGMAAALREDLLLHLAQYSGESENTEATAQLRLAIVFLDLASFTPLTESMGDAAAAAVVAWFSDLVRESVHRHHGRVVERIGDAFMLTFGDPRRAVICALEIDERTKAEDQFPALRGGIHFGPVLYREGGYVGSNVNVAARVANEAKRHQILVTPEVRNEAASLLDVEFVPVGLYALRGLAGELELFEVRGRERDSRLTVVDPVCGMELTSAGIAAKLMIAGSELSFCSEKCMRIFVETRR